MKVASYSVAINNGKNAQGEAIAPIWIRISVWRNNVKMGNHGVSNLRVGGGEAKNAPHNVKGVSCNGWGNHAGKIGLEPITPASKVRCSAD